MLGLSVVTHALEILWNTLIQIDFLFFFVFSPRRLSPVFKPFVQALLCSGPFTATRKWYIKKKSTTAWWHSRNVGHISVLSEPSLLSPLLHWPLCLPHIHPLMHLTSSSFLYSLISLFTHFKVSFNFLPVSSQCTSSNERKLQLRLFFASDCTSLYNTTHECLTLIKKKKSLFVCEFLNKDLM